MVLETITFKVQEKQKKDFKGKCEKNEVSMYSALKGLIDKYIKNEVTQNATTAEIEALRKQLEAKETQFKHALNEKDSEVAKLHTERDSFNIQNKENMEILTYICNWVLKITSDPLKRIEIEKRYSDFCFKFIYRNEKQI